MPTSLAAFAVLFSTLFAERSVGAAEALRVFAAASLTAPLSEVAEAYAAADGTAVVPVFGASSMLARQVMQGAPADVYVSASPTWMDAVDNAGLIVDGTRLDLLANRLVLIAPAGSGISYSFGGGGDLSALLADGPLAIGDPAHVPAGIYAKEALTRLGLWPTIKTRIARSADVRAALALVDRGEAPIGVVYASDVIGRPGVERVAMFPEDSHGAIIYPVGAVTGGDVERAQAFLTFLQTDTARAIFDRHGFLNP